MPRDHRVRWWIASQVNKLPGRCWADLVSWALGGRGYTLRSPQGAACRRDAVSNGACYCGKVRLAQCPQLAAVLAGRSDTAHDDSRCAWCADIRTRGGDAWLTPW